MNLPLVIGISGASGVQLGVRAIELMRRYAPEVPVHVVVTCAAETVFRYECGAERPALRDSENLQIHAPEDFAAVVASGSFPTRGMLVVPCSMRSLAEIATGVGTTLLSRAADVTLKQRRPLVLLTRETPLHLGHLRSMCAATEIGAIVMPLTPVFYTHPTSLEEAMDQLLARALEFFDIAIPQMRWGSGQGADRLSEDALK